jgi:TPR repeat protein
VEPNDITAQANEIEQLAKAERLYRRAFRLGDTTAAFNLACRYRARGHYRDAVRWFRKGAAAGDIDALYEVGVAELYGVGTPRNSAAAFRKLTRVAHTKGRRRPPSWLQCKAMVEMARALEEGWLVRRDLHAARRWLLRAARLRSRVAAAMLHD